MKKMMQSFLNLGMAAAILLGFQTGASAAPDGRVKLGIPQPEEGQPVTMTSGYDRVIGKFNPKTLEYVFESTFKEGPLAGEHVIYKIDPVTGDVTRNDGVNKGKFYPDGRMDTPGLGMIRQDENGRIWRGDELIGYTIPTKGYTFNLMRGIFERPVNQRVIAFLYAGIYTYETDLVKMKEIQAEDRAKGSVKVGIPQPDPTGVPVPIYLEKDTPFGTYNPQTLELIFENKYKDGPMAGQNVIFQIDPETGIVTRKDGTVKGRIYPDGSFDCQSLSGYLRLDPNGHIWRDDVDFGSVSLLECRSYGVLLGTFGLPCPYQQVMAYVYLGIMASDKDLARHEQYARERAEQQQKDAGQSQTDAGQSQTANNTITLEDSYHRTVGYIKPDGMVEDGYHRTVGYIKSDGMVEDGSHRTIGYIKSDGTVEDDYHRTIGYIKSDGTVEDDYHRTIAYATGLPREAAAWLYFFMNREP